MSLISLDLTGEWEFKEFPESARRMRDLEEGKWIPVSIPCSIYSALDQAGLINLTELFNNPKLFTWISEKPWIFRKVFEVSEDLAAQERKDLIFEGLDTISQIWLNDKCITKTDNMFIPHRFDVSPYLHSGRNVLLVKLLPSMETAKQRMDRYGKLNVLWGDPARVYLRKAQYQFGSDRNPSMPGCGIFRPVRLEGFCQARMENIHIRTIDCSQHYADIQISITINPTVTSQSIGPFECELCIFGGGVDLTDSLHFSKDDLRMSAILRIERPFLWWPNGFGVQHLYTLTSRLKQGSKMLDQQEIPFGIRTIHFHHADDGQTDSCNLEVNGQPIPIQGAVWVPPSLLPGQFEHQKIEFFLKKFTEAHGNLLRVWAGGLIEDSFFYDLCDRLGILVWQEFPFADAYYPDRNWFIDSIRDEAEKNIKLVRNHPSLAIWCGNNGIDRLHQQNKLGKGRKFYGKSIYHQILPELISELDPDREYLSSMTFADTNNRNETCSIAQYGCHSWPYDNPQTETPESVYTGKPLKTLLPELSQHSSQLFRPAHNRKEWIEQIQLAQARYAKEHVEQHRALNSIHSGQILNSWNDPCMAAGFSAIDNNGIPKALYYYARRFWSPVLVTLQKMDSNSEHKDLAVVLNDRAKPLTGFLSVELMNFHGQILDQIQHPLSMGPFAKPFRVNLPREFVQPNHPETSFLRLAVQCGQDLLIENCILFLPDQFLSFPDVHIDCTVQQREKEISLILSSPVFIKDLSIHPPKASEISENWFDLLPGRSYEIHISFKDQVPPPWIPTAFQSIPAISHRIV